jgi:preprotein translocase subunit SecA
MSLLDKIFGSKAARDMKVLTPFVHKVHEATAEISNLTNDELRAKTQEFKNRIKEGIGEEEERISSLKQRLEEEYEMPVDEKESLYEEIDELEKTTYDKTQKILDELLPEAFAVVKETAKRFVENEEVAVSANDFDKNLAAFRDSINIKGDKAYYQNEWRAGGTTIKWDMVHYDVQLIGGAVLHQGKIAEMATGEGKTLVATLPVYLNALPGKGVHVVTVNDYLAKRDAEWMGMMFEFHGLSVDCIDKHEPNSDERRKAYQADVTYGTNNEFGFDYLRDNMTTNIEELVQRKHNYAIVDEVDSVLIDDARTPLIISGPTPRGDKQEFDQLKPLVQKLYSQQRALVTQILAEAKQLIKKGDAESEKKGAKLLFRSHRGLPKNKALIKFLSEEGMKALMHKTENIYLAENQKNMHIIDDELFFVIDEKNNTIDLTDKGIDLLTEMTGDSNFYILPDIAGELAEMDKKNLSEQETIKKKSALTREYGIKSERVHTMNQLLKAYALFEKDVEYVIMDNKIKIVDEQTGRIMEGRRYSDGLHQAIEAKENVKVEAATQTYATVTLQNYFRMYKKLAGMTGTAETEAGELWDIYKLDVVVIPTNKPIVRKDMEDLIYKTKKEKYNAVILEIQSLVNQGRPVLVGTTSVETSELLSRMLKMKHIAHNVLNAKLHKKEADVVAEAGVAGAVTIATNMAGRGTDIKLGKGVKEAGGLAIIGTERHESRRVDRQLRGRAGRQGDPGSSQFFVSLEDNLMRLFGSDKISNIMDRLGLKEGDVIQHSMISKSIERAQRKVEENNFGIRKRLLEYDDVMNQQREVIYTKRRNALYGDRLAIDIANQFVDVTDEVVFNAQEARDYESFLMESISVLGVDASDHDEKDFFSQKAENLSEELYTKAWENYKLKSEVLYKSAYPIIKNVYETQSRKYENIALPISDGNKTLRVLAPLEKSYKTKGKELILSIEKGISLGIIDNAWKEHLRELDDLRQSVQGATYEQKDPLLIYKFESFELFQQMLKRINKEVVSFLVKGNLPLESEDDVKEGHRQKSDLSKIKTGRQGGETDAQRQAMQQSTSQAKSNAPVRVEKKVGRNDPCPCGSGKKYKHCHGKEA